MTHSLSSKLPPSLAVSARRPVPHQLGLALEPALLQDLTSTERATVIAQLAVLLLQAAGLDPGADDGER